MNLFDDEKLVEITQADIKKAINSTKNFDSITKKRIIANVLGAELGIKFLDKFGISADNQDSLYTIPAILKNTDIADIYIGNIKLDVRIVSDENHLFVPKVQFKYQIKPDIYIFMKLAQDYSYAEFIGAIAPEEINTKFENDNYYFVNKNTLYNELSLKVALNKIKPKSNVELDKFELLQAESMLVNFIDNEISEHLKEEVYKMLAECKEFRHLFKEFQKMEQVLTSLANTKDILKDNLLEVISGPSVPEVEVEEITEEDINSANLDEIVADTTASFVEDVIDSDYEGFDSMNDEEIINGEFSELSDDNTTEIIEEPGQLDELPNDEELANLDSFNDIENETENMTDDNLSFIDSTEQINTLDEPSFDIDIDSPVTNDIDMFAENTFTLDSDNNNVSENVQIFDEQGNVDFNLDESNERDLILDNEVTPLEEISPKEDLIFNDNNETINLNEDTPIELDLGDEPLEQVENLQNNDNKQDIINFDEISKEQNELDEFTNPPDNIEPVEELSDNNDNDANVDFDMGTNTQAQNEVSDEVENNFEENIGLFENNQEESTEENPIQQNEYTDSDDESEEYSDDLKLDDIISLINANAAEKDAQADAQEKEQSQDNDFEGFEEFTEDMALAVEQANPNIHNSQIPEEERENYNSDFDMFGETSSTQVENIKGNDVEELINESESKNNKTLDDYNLDEIDEINENSAQTAESSSEDLLNFTDDFSTDDKNNDNLSNNFEQSEAANNDNVIDFDKEIENLESSNIDFNKINTDDINIDDINLDDINFDDNINDLNMGINNEQATDVNEIPEIQSKNSPQYNEEMSQEISQTEENMYTEGNNQESIERLYDDENYENKVTLDNLSESVELNEEQEQYINQKQTKKAINPIFIGVGVLALIGALLFVKKDFILDKFNPKTETNTNIAQNEDMPVENEQENSNNENSENENIEKNNIGEIPQDTVDAAKIESSNNKADLLKQNISEPLNSNDIKKLYWEIPQELTYNDAIVKYLKVLGKSIKLDVQSNLLNVYEIPYSNKMILDVKINKSGDNPEANVLVSSGSKQIDKFVLQSVNAALKYIKAPTLEFQKDFYKFSLIINF
ncbi:hypothetical protein IJG72_04245 [bacterium]|nr:hypothetical protein [bacterium]